MPELFRGDEYASAVFGDDERENYRYSLHRAWGPGKRLLWVCLNPSTATESVLDPTLTRALGYAKQWGFGSMYVGNIFALRSTDPKHLYGHEDPVGRGNDKWLMKMHEASDLTVVGWGAHGKLLARGDVVFSALRAVKPVFALRVTKEGFPAHPLYLPADLHPVEYQGR